MTEEAASTVIICRPPPDAGREPPDTSGRTRRRANPRERPATYRGSNRRRHRPGRQLDDERRRAGKAVVLPVRRGAERPPDALVRIRRRAARTAAPSGCSPPRAHEALVLVEPDRDRRRSARSERRSSATPARTAAVGRTTGTCPGARSRAQFDGKLRFRSTPCAFCRVPRAQPSGFTLGTATISVPVGAPARDAARARSRSRPSRCRGCSRRRAAAQARARARPDGSPGPRRCGRSATAEPPTMPRESARSAYSST